MLQITPKVVDKSNNFFNVIYQVGSENDLGLHQRKPYKLLLIYQGWDRIQDVAAYH